MKEFWRRHAWSVTVVFLFLFAVYSNVRLLLRNYQINKRLTEVKAETIKEETANKKLKLLIQYYQTPSYQEVEARSRLTLKKADEKVLAIKHPATAENGALSDNPYENTKPVVPISKSNIQLWWEYFFK